MRRSLTLATLLVSISVLRAGAGTLQVTASANPEHAAYGQRVTLSGSVPGLVGGADFSWVQLATTVGNQVAIVDGQSRISSFRAPSFTTVLKFRFTATTASGSGSAVVHVGVSQLGGSLPPPGESGVAVGEVVCNDPGNTPAVATVPARVTATGGTTLTISAINGRDPDNTRVIIGGLPLSGVAYAWSLKNGNGVLSASDLSGTSSASLGVSLPEVNGAISASLALLINDAAGCGTQYVVQLVILPSGPTGTPSLLASISSELQGQTISAGGELVSGEILTLEASASAADLQPSFRPVGAGNPPTYFWKQIEGPKALLVGATDKTVRTVAPEVGPEGDAVSFQVTVSEGAEDAVATVSFPVVSPYLYFAQVAFGLLPQSNIRLRTVPVLINERDQTAENVTMEFFDSAGDSLPLRLDGQLWDPGRPFTIEGGRSLILPFEAVDDNIAQGWGRVRSDVKLTGLVLYQLVDEVSGAVQSEVSLFDSPRGSRFTSFFGKDDGLALAVAAPGDEPVDVDVVLLDDMGQSQRLSLALEPGRQTAFFVDQLQFPSIPEKATLIVEAPDDNIIATLLKTKGGLPFSTLPMAVRRRSTPNQPPVAVWRYRIGGGEFLDPPAEGNVTVTSPVDITLEAGFSTDDRGVNNLEFSFQVQQNLSGGGAILRPSTTTARILEVAEGTQGTITVTVIVTDKEGLADTASVTFEVSS